MTLRPGVHASGHEIHPDSLSDLGSPQGSGSAFLPGEQGDDRPHRLPGPWGGSCGLTQLEFKAGKTLLTWWSHHLWKSSGDTNSAKMVSEQVKWLFQTRIHAASSCSLLIDMPSGPHSGPVCSGLCDNCPDEFGGPISQAHVRPPTGVRGALGRERGRKTCKTHLQ